MKFVKMHGCGNDYIYIENAQRIGARTVRALSDRHFGVGADGVVLLSASAVADVRMRMYNADGSEGAMCGNAARCAAFLIYRNTGKRQIAIETESGVKTAQILEARGTRALVRVDVGRVKIDQKSTPIGTFMPILHQPYRTVGGEWKLTCLSVGNPHAVFSVDDPEATNVAGIGEEMQSSPLFPGGVNVGFFSVIGENALKLRVYERGSGETLACGTGAVAAATAAVLDGSCRADAPIAVHMRGGVLRVEINHDRRAYLTGDGVLIYEGETSDEFAVE